MTRRALLLIALAALAAVVLAGVVLQRRAAARRAGAEQLVAEVVNDHLRVLAAERPAGIEDGDARALRSWLGSSLGFAPVVPTADGTGLRLRGAAVGYVFDRKAAVVLYRLRLHQLTLLAFRAGGLAWPSGASGAGAAPVVASASARGFRAVLWRAGEVGYALVSDSSPEELVDLARRLATATSRGGDE